MRKILFICEHNSARSQMAEAYLNFFADGRLFAESAGLEPGALNSYVVEILKEEGIDISTKKTQGVFELFKQQKQYDAIIAVCSPAVSAQCPIFPGRAKRFNWPFDDPSKLAGSHEEILAQTRSIRDQIKKQVLSFIQKYEEMGLKLFME
jgi:arsenate reductase